LCEEAGTDLGQWLTRDRTIKQIKALDSDLEKALGRLSNGLYVLTTKKGNVSSAMFASWVAQASFKPLGISIAVAKDRAIESLLHVGDRFVLNVLEEGNYQGLMKHFLKRFPPGSDRFAGVKTYPATNGSPILGDALAYMECEVKSRMDCGDHWTIYATVSVGRVSKPDALSPDGERFLTYVEIAQRFEEERQRAEKAEQARRDAIPRLLGMGLSVEQVAEALGLSVEDVQAIAQE